MPPKSSQDMPDNEPRVDKDRDEKHAAIKDADCSWGEHSG
jgi:hypothetical protein